MSNRSIDTNVADEYLLSGTQDPSVTPTSAEQGTIFIRVGDLGGDIYVKQDRGLTTNWTMVSSGGGSGITSLNGQTEATQTFASGSTGTSPAFSSSGGVHTLNIPLATSPGVTSGTISNSTLQQLFSQVEQVRYVAKNGNDLTGDGSFNKPFLTISAAMSAITDATPSKRYVINVAAGNYSEAAISLKPNVFVVGEQRDTVRITAPVSMDATWLGNSSLDNRSGFSQATLLSACNFDWNTVQSAAGKLYFNEVSFGSTVTMNGYNNAIAQAQFDSCLFFGAFTVSGINVGVHSNNTHYATITLNQHPSLPSILVATGGRCATLVLNALVNNFNRRSALFAFNFYIDTLTVNGPSAYADLTDSSIPRFRANLTNPNGGNIVYLNSNIPYTSNAISFGDVGRQYLYNFSFVHASTESDLYLLSMGANYTPDTAGRGVNILADGFGLNPNVNGGNILLSTSTTSGTGIRGRVEIEASELSMGSTKIVNLAAGTLPTDGVNVSQLTLRDANSIFVSLTGSDVTGNGSQYAPFRTVQAAIDYVEALADVTSNYAIQILPGDYSADPVLTLKRPRTHLVGMVSGADSKATQLPSITVNPRAVVGGVSNSVFSLSNLLFTGASSDAIVFNDATHVGTLVLSDVYCFADSGALHALYATGSLTASNIYAYGCIFNNQLTTSTPAVRLRGGYRARFIDCRFFAGADSSSQAIEVDSNSVAGTYTIASLCEFSSSSELVAKVKSTGSFLASQSTFTSTIANSTAVELQNTSVFSSSASAFNVPVGTGFAVKGVLGCLYYNSLNTYVQNQKVSSAMGAGVINLATSYVLA